MSSSGKLRLTVDGVTALATFRPETAPEMVAAFLGLLPMEDELLQSIWSGHAASVSLTAFDPAPPETPVNFIVVGMVVVPEAGDELLIGYGPAYAMAATGPQRVTRVAQITENLEVFVEQLAQLGTDGSSTIRLEREL